MCGYSEVPQRTRESPYNALIDLLANTESSIILQLRVLHSHHLNRYISQYIELAVGDANTV